MFFRLFTTSFLALCFLLGSACSPYMSCVKAPDDSYTPTVYGSLSHVVVSYDNIHMNYHCIFGWSGCPSFSPFRRVLDAQGHVVGEGLPDYPFAIANPANSAEAITSNLHVIVAPQVPHTPEEIQEIRFFIENAGNVLVTTDHDPYPLSVEALLAEFGIHTVNARVQCANDGYSCFATPSQEGRVPLVQAVGAVKLYEGSAFTTSNSDANCEIAYGPGAVDILTGTNAQGWCHTVSVTIGCGKLLVAASNEPFSAMKSNFGAMEKYGLSDPANPYAEEWLQNQIEWLVTRLQPGEGTCPL